MSPRKTLTPKLPKLPQNRIRRFLVIFSVATLGYFVALSLWIALAQPNAFGSVVLGFLAGALFTAVLCGVLGAVVAAQLWVFAPDLVDENSPARGRWKRLVEAIRERLAEPEQAEPSEAEAKHDEVATAEEKEPEEPKAPVAEPSEAVVSAEPASASSEPAEPENDAETKLAS